MTVPVVAFRTRGRSTESGICAHGAASCKSVKHQAQLVNKRNSSDIPDCPPPTSLRGAAFKRLGAGPF